MNTNELEAVLGRFDIDSGFAEAWKREWRYRRCLPWNLKFTSAVTIYARRNYLTTHCAPGLGVVNESGGWCPMGLLTRQDCLDLALDIRGAHPNDAIQRVFLFPRFVVGPLLLLL